MTIRNNKALKVISIFLSLVLLVSALPLSAFNAVAAGTTYESKADPSTMDDWKDFFLTDPLSTENAGGVWTDKSVFTDASAFAGTGITKDEENSFLVALSTIGSNIAITGMANTPTDTILVLDVSGSMNSDQNDVAEELVEAANESIAALLSANRFNRVGVVLYSNEALLLLPLGRYTTVNNVYLDYKLEEYYWFFSLVTEETVSINKNVVLEETTITPSPASKQVSGATYIQQGVILAMNQFTAASNSPTITDPSVGTLNRKPVMVLMSDGAPTQASTAFTAPDQNELGNRMDTSAAQGFVTQLSAAYAKYQIEAKYKTDCLFYTLGLGVTDDPVATSVLDPANSNNGIDEFWEDYNDADVGDTIRVEDNRMVTKINADLEQVYVDEYFAVDKTATGGLA